MSKTLWSNKELTGQEWVKRKETKGCQAARINRNINLEVERKKQKKKKNKRSDKRRDQPHRPITSQRVRVQVRYVAVREGKKNFQRQRVSVVRKEKLARNTPKLSQIFKSKNDSMYDLIGRWVMAPLKRTE